MKKSLLNNSLETGILEGKKEEVCKIVSEFVGYKGELSNLLNCAIDKYGRYFLSRNLWVAQSISNCLTIINNIPKKNITRNTLFKKTLIELFCILTSLKAEQKQLFDEHVVTDAKSVEFLLYEYINAPLVKEFLSLTAEENCKYMGILAKCVKKADKKNVKILLDYFLFGKDIDKYPVSDEILFEEISHIKIQYKSDIVWYLWKLLIKYIAKDETVKDWCTFHLNIYATNFQKKVRNTRLNLLYYCYLSITKDREISNKEKTNDIEILDYATFFNSDDVEPEPVPRQPRQPRPRNKTIENIVNGELTENDSNSNSNLSVKSSNRKKNKTKVIETKPVKSLDYLFTFKY